MYNIVHSGGTPMKEVTFTEFRRNAAALFTSVEQGEIVRVFRHGKPIAEVVPIAATPAAVSWKRPQAGIPLEAGGASLSREILRERDLER